MKKKISLTGIKPTGRPHIGNYIGAIKPALEMAKNEDYLPVYFIADYHALNSVHDPAEFRDNVYGVAATWLSLGLNPEKAIFYRQSDVPEILELHYILSCFTPKGLMNRAHAYKAAVDKNLATGLEQDHGMNMGLFTYPILMAADILLFQSDIVPVGKDQVQHVEIARDIAESFNRTYGASIQLPEYKIGEETAVIPGLDGRKMSKSYKNTIPLFAEAKELEKLIKKIKTDSTPPDEPKDPDSSTIFLLYKEFASEEQIEEMRNKYIRGISWGEAKQELFQVMNAYLEKPRENFYQLMANPNQLNEILAAGAEKARVLCKPFLHDLKKIIGCK